MLKKTITAAMLIAGTVTVGLAPISMAEISAGQAEIRTTGSDSIVISTGRSHASGLLAQNVDSSQGIPITSTTVANIAERVAPAIVNIEVNQPVPSMSGMPGFNFPFGNMPEGFDFFFNGQKMPRPGQGQNPGSGKAPTPSPNLNKSPGQSGSNPPPELSPQERRLRERHNTGSGFIVKDNGYIVTNAHVVKGATEINVTLNDKRSFKATAVGVDSFSDLAVLKIEATGLPVAEMGTSTNLRPGEFVIAIGSPMGYDHSVTLGIVSAVGRSVTDINGNINFIQTDAAINPGNSGGPLLNFSGQVVGVNTAIAARAQNIGFSIPIDIAKPTVNELITNKKVLRPFLGLMMRELSESLLKGMGLPLETKGVLVSNVIEEGSAAKAGLVRTDIIQKIDGKDIGSSQQLQETVRARKVGETLHLIILRNKEIKPVTVLIGEYSETGRPSKRGPSSPPQGTPQPNNSDDD